MQLMSQAAVILALQCIEPSTLKDKSMFDLDIILNFDRSLVTRKRYLDKLLKDKGFTYLGKGRHRMTYLSPNKRFVLKFPRYKEGVEANRSEAKIWKNHLNGKPTKGLGAYSEHPAGAKYAPCRLLQDCIIMMVAVVESYGETVGDDSARYSGAIGGSAEGPDHSLPDWCNEIDACQVGKLASGKLVAYDYA
jgi:hypothetical protein